MFWHGRGGQLIQAAQPAPGLERGGAGDHRRGRVGGEPAIQQTLGNVRPRGVTHQHHDGQRAGVQAVDHRAVGRGGVPRQHHERRGQAPVGDGDPRRRGHRRADARNDLERDAGLDQRQRLLAAPPEHERIAALQADHVVTAAGLADHQAVDRLLGHRRPAGALAHVEPARLGRQRPQLGPRQRVEQHQVGLAQPPVRAHRQQVDVARAGAHQGHAPAHDRLSW
jgi:hypothetical protein